MRRQRLHPAVRATMICATAAVVVAGCSTGDDDDSAPADSSSAATTAAPETTAGSTETTMADESGSTETTEAAPETTAGSTETTAAGGSGEITTGPGVTDTEINLAILTDLSGPFAAGAAVQVTGFNAYWDAVNADGGVCDRQVVVDVQDHGYDPQTAVSQYQTIADSTLAVQQLLGSPMVAALLPQLEEDGMYVGGMGWASVVLPARVAQLPGTTYSIQGANAIDWLMDQGQLASGDSVGVVFFEGDFGGDVAAGVSWAAEENGIGVVEQPVTPADSDLSSQVAAMQQEGVKAVIIGGSPGTLGAYAGAALAAGLEVPIVGANPVFNPSLLDSPAGDFIAANYTAVQSVAPYSSDQPGPMKAVEQYTAAGGDVEGWEVPLAYGQAYLLHDALEHACEAGNLTREGVVDAMRATTDLSTEGVFPDNLDYSTVGEPPTRSVFVATVDAAAPGGLTLVDEYEGPDAVSYSFGG